MACKYICDGCGTELVAAFNGRDYIKPHTWYQRRDDDGMQDACSRECIDKIAEETGKTDLVLPI